jgi:hypothetical protein
MNTPTNLDFLTIAGPVSSRKRLELGRYLSPAQNQSRTSQYSFNSGLVQGILPLFRDPESKLIWGFSTLTIGLNYLD